MKIGDRVIVNDRTCYNNLKGMAGVVCYKDHNVAVEFYTPIRGGHTCGGICKDGYGWYLDKDEVSVLPHTLIDLEDFL